MLFGGLGRGEELSGSLVNLQQQAVWHSVWGGSAVKGDQWNFEGLRTLSSTSRGMCQPTSSPLWSLCGLAELGSGFPSHVSLG